MYELSSIRRSLLSSLITGKPESQFQNRFKLTNVDNVDNNQPVDRADDRTRTDNLLFTRQLLCRLSYVGTPKYLKYSASCTRTR